MSFLKRHFTVVIDSKSSSKEHGLYVSSKPSSAARKAVSKLCADNKNKKVKFSIREITQGSKKKTYGPYLGYMQKLDKPIELEGRIIKYKPVAKLIKKKLISNLNGGGQAPKPDISPFQKAIFAACKDTKLPIPYGEISRFAESQAQAYPGKQRKFNQENVNAIRNLFVSTYKSQSKPTHNPNNLFGHLLREGRKLGIEEELLQDYLKWYISQPNISKISENPRQEDIDSGYYRMLREISPGANMFKNVCREGISPDTIGHNQFAEFIRHNPPSEYMWAFDECPPLIEVQKRMCFKKCGRLENISCFMAGMFFNPDGKIGFFKQSTKRERPDPEHQIGAPAVLWPFRVGHYVNIPSSSNKDGLNSYSASGDYVGLSERVGAISSADYKGFMDIVPRVAENIRQGEMDEILKNPDYFKACKEAMDKIGGIPVSLNLESSHQEVVNNTQYTQNQNRPSNNGWGAAGI